MGMPENGAIFIGIVLGINFILYAISTISIVRYTMQKTKPDTIK
jgi:uncharacterized membrane protein HdeD (DUF308 family)